MIMDQVQQGTCNDFSIQFYNDLLRKKIVDNNEEKDVQNTFETFSSNSSNNNSLNENTNNKINNKVYKYNIYEDKFLNELLGKEITQLEKNDKETNTIQNETNNNPFINTENKNNEKYHNNNISLNNIYGSLEMKKNNKPITLEELEKEFNNINNNNVNNYLDNLNNSLYNLNINHYHKKLYNNKSYFSGNNMEDYMMLNTPQENMLSSTINNHNFKTIDNILKFKTNKQNEIFNDKDIRNHFFINSFPVNDDYNQFLNTNIITEGITEKNSEEDPNSIENLKKIEQQINSLLFSSQKTCNSNDKEESNNIVEKLNDITNNNSSSNNNNININDNVNDDSKFNMKNMKKTDNEKSNNLNKNITFKKKPSLSRLVSQLDSMVETDNDTIEINDQNFKGNNKNITNKTNDIIPKKSIKNYPRNKNSTDKNTKFDYNIDNTKNKIINNKKSQEKILTHKTSQIIKNKYYIQNGEKNKTKSNFNDKYKKSIQDNNIKENYYDNLKEINNYYENLKFKKYKRKSFDECKLRDKSEFENYKNTQLNHRYSTANIKTTEKIITQDFYDELTEAINKTVRKIKAKPNDLKKREILFRYIKSIAKKIFPDSKVYRYGSIENGFSLTDGDIDICILNKDDFKYTPAECVEILGEKLKNNGINDIKLLIRARVPIIKMKDNKSGISCDIGFQNKLAIQNTKLINAYSKIDERFKQMVFIVKYWSKMKNINEPYMGTLSSYCFILMIIHFLQIRKPPVLPNLQKIYLNNFDKYEYVDKFNVSFFEDIENLHKYWNSENNESLGELLVEFFKYYANDFPYISGVASIRAGNIISKEEKEWTREHQFEINKTNSVKDRYWFCVEDPFEITHNLGRPVDRKSLFKIRGEFLKATKILNSKNFSGTQLLDKILEKNI